MDIRRIEESCSLNAPACEVDVASVEFAMEKRLPAEFRALLLMADGFMLQTGVGVYGTREIQERNATFEVSLYAPNFLAIGDDSGGRALMLRYDRPGVFAVDQGVMDPDAMELVANTLSEWVAGGCKF